MSSPADARRPFSLLLVLLALTVLAWPNLFLKGQVPVDGNVLRLFYPNWAFLHAHPPTPWQWPLWNPTRDLGEPFLADPQSLAGYPPMWILCRLSGFDGFTRLWILCHTLLAGYFMRKWMYGVTGDSAASAASAIVIAFNGYFVAHGTLLNHFASAAYLPVVLYCFSTGRTIGLGIALALQWLAGFPPFSVLTGVGLLAWSLAAGAARVEFLSRLGKGSAIALGLCAFQLIPFVELLRHSVRPVVLSPGVATEFSEPAGQLLRMLFVPQWPFWSRSVAGDQAVVTFYVGLVVLAIAGWAAIKGGRTERLLSVSTLISAGLSLGSSLPGYTLLIPLRIFRFPSNWLLLASMGFALLGGLGIGRLAGSRLKWTAVALILGDLLLFAQHGRTPWFTASFLEDPPALARSSMPLAETSRIYHLPGLTEALAAQTSKSFGDWLFFRDALVPSFGTAFGLREVSSYQVLKLARAARFQERIDIEGPFSAPARWAGIRTVVAAMPAGPDRPPRIDVVSRSNGMPPVFFPTASTTQRTSVSASSPGRVDATIATDRADIVVFSEVLYPGWRVRLDGQPRTPVPFEDTFLAVEVPPGEHQLTFRYSPSTFWTGLAVSVSALVCIPFWANISNRATRAWQSKRRST